MGGTHMLMVTAGDRSGTVSEVLSYDRGMLDHVVAFEEAATGSKIVTIMGIGLGASTSSYTLAVRLGDSACEATRWVSSSCVYCSSAGGTRATLRIHLTSGQMAATVTEAYSYERPMLIQVMPGNAATTGRMTVTCLGSNFGLVDFTIAFRIGGTACEASRWVADSTVKCKLPAGVSSNRWVEVSTGGRKSAGLFSLFTYSHNIGSFQVWSNGAFKRKCDKYPGTCGWTGAVHGLRLNEPGTPRAAACAGTDGLWPQAPGKWRMCSPSDCALGSCTSNSELRSDYPMTRAFSYDSPTIFHHSTVEASGNSAHGSTAGGWLLTIVGRNFGFYADVVNVSVASSIFDNPLSSLATGRYWHGKAVCRIPCVAGAEAQSVGQLSADEYQCDASFVAGGGNTWMSDSHILCIMPAGVGVAKGLSVAIGSSQVDGPSPVPSLRESTRFGQANGFGSTLLSLPYAAEESLLYVDSSRSLFGWGYCQRQSDAIGHAIIVAGVNGKLVTGFTKVCQRDNDCLAPLPAQEYDEFGEALPIAERLPDVDEFGVLLPAWKCIGYGTLVRKEAAPAVTPGLEVVIATSLLGAAQDVTVQGDQVRVESWSLATMGLDGEELSRPPGINVGPSDLELDQVTYSPNAFSYSRPYVHLVLPREGPVRRSRRITVDGSDFGFLSRYIEVVVVGIPQRLHAQGTALAASPTGGAPEGATEEVCCSCDWYCSGTPRVCKCRPAAHDSRRRCIAGSETSEGCREYYIETCVVSRVHQQLSCTVPDIYHELDEGLLPIWGAIPDQKLSAAGDREFHLCSTSINGFDGPCPLSKIPAFYVGWHLTVTYPVSGEYDIREIIMYEGKADSASKDFKVELKDALTNKPECDDQFGCPGYTLTPHIRGVASNTYNKLAHPFPGFCGQHQVRVRIDGHASMPRSMSRENVNKQSLIYLDDKPHVISSAVSADGMKLSITFDVQTTHARKYRSRPGLRADVFKYDCNPKPAVYLAQEEDCEEVLMAAAVSDPVLHSDGEKLKTSLTSGISGVDIFDPGWGCVCPTSNTQGRIVQVSIDCGELIAIDPRGMGSGFRAKVRARPCAFSSCESAVDDDSLDEFGTGLMTEIIILDRGTGYYGGLQAQIQLIAKPLYDGLCKDFTLIPKLESSQVSLCVPVRMYV